LANNVPEIPPPVLLAALVCDTVILDALTGKATVVGVFDVINAAQYPAHHHNLGLFFQLTDGRGTVGIRIRLVDLKNGEDETLWEGNVEQEFVDVRQVANVVVNVGGLRFPHPGEYRVQLSVGTHFLGERRVICRQIDRGPGGKIDERS
jgi:hypothetical protein